MHVISRPLAWHCNRNARELIGSQAPLWSFNRGWFITTHRSPDTDKSTNTTQWPKVTAQPLRALTTNYPQIGAQHTPESLVTRLQCHESKCIRNEFLAVLSGRICQVISLAGVRRGDFYLLEYIFSYKPASVGLFKTWSATIQLQW